MEAKAERYQAMYSQIYGRALINSSGLYEQPGMVVREADYLLEFNRAEAAERTLAAALRLLYFHYRDWSTAGGLKECTHGVAAMFPCRNCDINTALAAIRALNPMQEITEGILCKSL